MRQYLDYRAFIIAAGSLLDCVTAANTMSAILGKRKLHPNLTRAVFCLFWFFSTLAVCYLQISWRYYMFYLFLLLLFSFLYEASPLKRMWAAFTLGSTRLSCLSLAFLAQDRVFYAPEVCIAALVFFLCFAAMKRLLFTQAAEAEGEINRSWLSLLLLVSGAGMTALFGVLLETEVSKSFAVICCVCILIIDLSTFFLYHALHQNDMHIKQRDSYKQLLYYYKNQMDVIAESQSSIRALRHDMKNHVLHIRAQLQNEKYEDALHYLDELTENMQSNTEYVSTGNKEVDCLLNYKIRIAKKILNRVEYRIRIPSDYEWKSFDFNIVAGNLLDNATEAAGESREKFLEIDIRADKGILLFHIANSYENTPKRQGKKFLSAKKQAGEHGVGLQNVKRIVEKQNGDMQLRYADGVFEADVMLYMSQL